MMNFKPSSLFFFLLVCLTIITTSKAAELFKVKIISPTDGQTVKKGESLLIKYETTSLESGEICSLHVILLSPEKYQLYQIVADQNVDGKPHEVTVPWESLAAYSSYSSFYIRFYENYKAANSESVQRVSKDIKFVIS
ncbi:hypothetical protein C1646_690833 [Rhizophagus diaphanus]|nr:hypothetical protein C1646_690833 [Rhizophagus diaphanus] [Rhizophagus sp. MUCL 43196]